MHPLLLASFILEPDLDDSHGQPSLLGQLLSHMSSGFGGLSEHVLEHLQLLGLDCGTRTSSFAVFAIFGLGSFVVGVILIGLGTVMGGVLVHFRHAELVGVLFRAVGGLLVCSGEMVESTHEMTLSVESDLVSSSHQDLTRRAFETIGMEEGILEPNCRFIPLNLELTCGALWTVLEVEVLLTVEELIVLRKEASLLQRGVTLAALETAFVMRVTLDSIDKVVLDASSALKTIHGVGASWYRSRQCCGVCCCGKRS